MEFTKGKWKQRQMFENPLCTTFKDGTECYHNEINIHDNTGRIIASVNYSTDTPNMGWGKNETIEKWKANAQLIATAPKMLETLNKVATFLKWQSEVDKTDGCINAYNDCIKVINQATKID